MNTRCQVQDQSSNPKIYFGDLKPKKGKIHIVRERCKGCGFCVEYCPREVLEMSEEFNVKGYHPPVVKDEDECVFCQLCETICPEFAVYVTLKEEAACEKSEEGENRP